MLDFRGIKKDDIITVRVDELLSQADIKSCRKNGADKYEHFDLFLDVANVYSATINCEIRNKALMLIKDILKFEAEQPLGFGWFLRWLPYEAQRELFSENYNEMIKLCFEGYSPENIEFSDNFFHNAETVVNDLKDKSLLRDIWDKILLAAIDYKWVIIIEMILNNMNFDNDGNPIIMDNDSDLWPKYTFDKIVFRAIEKEWNEVIVKIINNDKFFLLKEDTIYCLFDYFCADVNRFHSELSLLFKRVGINLSASFSGIICRGEEKYLEVLSLARKISGKDSLPFSISYSPTQAFLFATNSSPATVAEVLDHQIQWIQMRASQIFGNAVDKNVNWWSLCNGLKSDNRGLITDVDKSLIDSCNSILERSGFNGARLPLIVLKDEEKELSRDENWFNVLGEYIAEKQEIILYGRAIAKASLELDVDENILRAVVLIHELGHYITHAHPLNGITEESFDNVLFSRSDPDFLECIAQLFAYWATKEDGQYNSHDVFDKLASKQSGPYKVYLKYVNESPKIILQAIAVLRANDNATTISDLNVVINKLKN